jgi:histidyl-tRNA synthetase
MANNINSVKGFNDFTEEEAKKRKEIKKIIEEQFELYGFEPAETPIIETEEFVKGENNNDDAVRDVFKLQDRGKRELALRYEFTFQLKRIAKNKKLPYKRYQIGEVFRDEPIRKGRTRQFIQCDIDIIGSNNKNEAEILSLAKETFEQLGIPITIYVNNRKLINEILVNIEEKNREQIIRELDKLDKLTKKEVADNLKPYNAERLIEIFTAKEEQFKNYNYYKEIQTLKEYTKEYGVNIEFRPYLARGFSYYKGSVYEIWSDKLNVALCGGGTYYVNETEATGISFGIEPIMILTNTQGKNTKVQIISAGQDKESIQLTKKIRKKGIATNLILDKTISKALEYANNKNIENIIILGKKEVEEKKYTIKNMKTGKEKLLTEEEIIKELQD